MLDEVTEFAAFDDVLSGIGSDVFVNGDDVWFTNIPDLWLLRDTTGDGVADFQESVARGFGVTTRSGNSKVSDS